jgi:hypothetical protein
MITSAAYTSLTLNTYCFVELHYMLLMHNNSWHFETESQTLMSGGNGWMKRQFTKSEPHGMRLSNDGTHELIRLSDGHIIDTIPSGLLM